MSVSNREMSVCQSPRPDALTTPSGTEPHASWAISSASAVPMSKHSALHWVPSVKDAPDALSTSSQGRQHLGRVFPVATSVRYEIYPWIATVIQG